MSATVNGHAPDPLDDCEAGRLTPEQRALAEMMSDMSEEAWCAGWLHGLEFDAWEIAHGRVTAYGYLDDVGLREYRAEMLRLSEACGGWIVWHDSPQEEGERWVPMAEWLRMVDSHAPR